MRSRAAILLLVGVLAGQAPAWAGNVYEVTSTSGAETVRYEVQFGGGKLQDQFTAFDPASKTFVYLSWDRNGEPPAPVTTIWDHRTGESIPLYAFPNVAHPLPVIPSIEAMKACPVTGDRDFKATLQIIID